MLFSFSIFNFAAAVTVLNNTERHAVQQRKLIDLGSISSTFYEQLLHAQIPKA